MFSAAYKIASQFTHPVILSRRFFDGTVECALASFTILNSEGWLVTAAHVVQPISSFEQHKKEIEQYNNKVDQINKDNKRNSKQKRQRISKLPKNNKWVTNYSFWWGQDKASVPSFNILAQADIAIGRLENFDLSVVKNYPIIIDPKEMKHGTSLCKLGFPFHEIKATFDEATGQFNLEPGSIPVPRFPIEGMYTREIITAPTPDRKFQIKFIETSTPGLRGQSGGPIFDVNRRTWGIQSHTRHLPLGFSPKVIKGGKEIEENQFINVGWGVHPETLVSFLRENNVSFSFSSEK